jgi:hypothetical protein
MESAGGVDEWKAARGENGDMKAGATWSWHCSFPDSQSEWLSGTALQFQVAAAAHSS